MTPDLPSPLARRALTEYGHADALLTPLGESDSTVFRVEAAGRERLVLRLHDADRHGEQALHSELRWLDHLARADGPTLPRPVPTPGGAWVVPLGEGETLATLLTWVDGEPPGGPLNAGQAAQVGELLAELHLRAEVFTPPPGFERPTYDLAHFRRGWADLRATLGPGRMTDEQAGVIEAGWPTLAALLDPVEDVPGGLGLVHADAHPGNLLWHGGEVRLIDFGRLGWGPFLLDVAEGVLDLDPPERAACLEGYRRRRPLPGGVDLHLRALICLAALENLAFLARRPHEVEFAVRAFPSIVGAVSRLTADATSS
ncbi:phosphotransferase [Deinococcus sp. YIM 134068]|uniref:phosphotransferase enzyme family protein n=1 Tax=Deinococcus lichenicola TaxID=3118910 RepID=UPI002F92835D